MSNFVSSSHVLPVRSVRLPPTAQRHALGVGLIGDDVITHWFIVKVKGRSENRTSCLRVSQPKEWGKSTRTKPECFQKYPTQAKTVCVCVSDFRQQHTLTSATTTCKKPLKTTFWKTSQLFLTTSTPPDSIHPSLYSASNVASTVSPFASISLFAQRWITPIKVKCVCLSLSLHLSFSPSTLIFLASTHNEWLKNVHSV